LVRVLLFFMLLLFSCGQHSLIEMSKDIRESFSSFIYQVARVRDNVVKAARDIEVVSEANFKSPETKQYISDARSRLEEVRKLKEEFKDLVKDTDFYFAYAYRKAYETKDKELRERYIRYINEKKREFVKLYRQVNSTILELERISFKLNDILNGLEIAGAMSIVAQKKEEMMFLQKKMLKKLEQIELMISKGYDLLNLELSIGDVQNEVFAVNICDSINLY